MGGHETVKGDQVKFYKANPSTGTIAPPGFAPVNSNFYRKIELSELQARPLTATGQKFGDITLKEIPSFLASIRYRFLPENLVSWYTQKYSRRVGSVYHVAGLVLFVGMYFRTKVGHPEYVSDWGLGHTLADNHHDHAEEHH